MICCDICKQDVNDGHPQSVSQPGIALKLEWSRDGDDTRTLFSGDIVHCCEKCSARVAEAMSQAWETSTQAIPATA